MIKIERKILEVGEMFMERYGLSFNLRALKENKPEVSKRFKDIKIEDEEKVYFNDLTNICKENSISLFARVDSKRIEKRT